MADFLDTFMWYGAILAMLVLVFSLLRAMLIARRSRAESAVTDKVPEQIGDRGSKQGRESVGPDGEGQP